MSTNHELVEHTGPMRRAHPADAGTGVRRDATAPGRSSSSWQRRFARQVAAADVTIIVTVVSLAVLLGMTAEVAPDRAHTVSGIMAALALLVSLLISRAWEARVLGSGTQELKRLYRAVAWSSIGLGLGGLALQIESVRVWVFLVIPLCGVACVASRYGLRKVLHHQRRRGACMLEVLAVGADGSVLDLVRRTRRDPYFGWAVTGACTPTGTGPDGGPDIAGVPVVGDLDSVGTTIASGHYHVVAVGPAPGWGPARLHHLAWQLEESQTEIAVDPGLMEIAGPRLHITPVDGLPLLRLTKPRFTGGGRVLKAVIDRVGAALLLVVTAPVLLAIATAIRLSDGGPALFRQERVGVGGRTFSMLKFRSMAVGAEIRATELRSRANDADGPLFKLRADPRITRVGAVLRKYSLDELPQLVNVVTGSMSLVGPRPPLPAEVQTYGRRAQRRLLVRPGMTGLWQVSGRSDLSWEETVRLDLRYVENWSIALDLTILWKTFGAVGRGDGAY